MMEVHRPREFMWDLAMPTPRFFMAPFGETMNWMDRDMAHAERAMDKAWHGMSKHMHDAMGEMAMEAKKAVEITNDADKLMIKCDVSSYKPEELWVKTTHHMLIMHGKHEEKDKDGKHYTMHEFTRKFILPKEVDPSTVVSWLKDGSLCIEAPKKAIEPKERMIAIEHK